MQTVRPGKITVFPVTPRGYLLAQRLSGELEPMEIHHPSRLKGSLTRKAGAAFKDSSAILFVSATGIAVRAVAPHLKGKHLDPAVVVADEAGRFVVSLVSGHLGGANRLAERIAAIIGAIPVITTATDAMGLPCAEDIARSFSCAIEDVGKIKRVNSAIVNGGRVFIVDRRPCRLKAIKKAYGASKAFTFKRTPPEDVGLDRAVVFITAETVEVPEGIRDKTLILRPREFVVGIGCRRGVTAREISAAFNEILGRAGVSPLSVRSLASIEMKKNEKGLLSFARRMGLDIEFFTPEELNSVRPPSGGSKFVREKTGAAGVCEPAALFSAGARSLWVKKIKAGRVTAAMARAPFTS
ncbi:MAG: cobalt-precorrin 5A hydrolase [Deltaproteobacteria bacterium]|nr:cobalt-precorrin 5A hydrolase [Deltaproteobacteria bacterium]